MENVMTHSADDSPPPYPVEISVDALLRLLRDVPGRWNLSADDSHIFLLVDEEGEGRGYIDLAEERVVRINPAPIE